jgi:predicted acylesterase/phospholipase RssA
LAADLAAFMKTTAAVLLVCVLSLSGLLGCTVVRQPSPPLEATADSPGGIRVMGADHRFADVSIGSVARRAQDLRGGEPVTILALSGGGADGAFGAGALVGLTQAGVRPRFSVVTGVSAGAFLAAYAFLGPEWDQQLIDSYTSGRAEHLLQPRGLGMIFNSSVYRGRPLEQLVDHYLSDALIQAVANEAASGRLLLVATTNVDTGETVIWDMGSIAMNGGPNANALFRDVLVASASVPGLFPPVIIRVQGEQGDYSEAHVDGTTTVPFLVPSALLHAAGQVTDHSPPEVYVIVDGQLSEQPKSVQLHFRTIVSRSISTGLTHMTRTTLELTATTARLQGANLQYSAIPTAYPNLAPFDFHTSTMRSLYQYGYECAHTGRLWVASQAAVSDHSHQGESASGQRVGCPADDEYIARFAVR